MNKNIGKVLVFLFVIFSSFALGVSCNQKEETEDIKEPTIYTIPKEETEKSTTIIEIVNVVFDSDGGTDVSPEQITKGEKATKPNDPIKAGFIFGGWFLGDNEWDFNESVTNDLVLKAIWVELAKYTISFIGFDGEVIKTEEILYGEKPVDFTVEDVSNDILDAKFVSWDKEFETVKGDAEYHAMYELTRYKGENSEVTLSNNIVSIYNFAFKGCTTLESIILPNSLTYIGGEAFSHCTSLKSIVIPEGVICIEAETFFSCTSLEIVTLPSTIEYIAFRAFAGCTSLKDITIPEGVTAIDISSFAKCEALTKIVIPFSVNAIYDKAFASCTSLKTITILNSEITIEGFPFYNCPIEEAIAPTTVINTLDKSALKLVYLIGGEEIPETAFFGCETLVLIYIPKSVISIGQYAFAGCSSLSIYCEAESQPEGWDKHWNSDNRPVSWDEKSLIY